MKILVGADGKNLESSVAKRFGHANYFIIYDAEAESINALANVDENHNHKNLQGFRDNGIKIFIVGNIGPHAFKILNASDSRIYLARKQTVKEAIDRFLNGELKLLTEPTVKKSIGHKH